MKITIATLTALLAFHGFAAASAVRLEVVPDRAEAMYRCGETATFTVKVCDSNGVPLTAGRVKTVLDNFGTELVQPTNEVDLAAGNPFTVRGTLTKPGFLRLSLTSDIRDFPRTLYCNDSWYVAVGFEPERLRPAAKCPDDFDDFWAAGRREIAAIPPDVRMELNGKWSDTNWNVWCVSFASVRGVRVYGWLAKERKYGEAKLPVRVQVAAAGFGGWSQDPMRKPGWLNLFLTVFPFAPDAASRRPDYDKLNADCRTKWGAGSYSTAGIASADARDGYYYPVVLGVDRAIDWVAARADADTSRFVYEGTSQGGGFGFYSVALNGHFTKAVIHVPALTDHSAHLDGRLDGWPRFVSEQKTPAARAAAERNAAYFDGVNFAARVRVPVIVTCGTSDAACHPHCVWTAFNQIPTADKQIWTGFGMTHSVSGDFYSRAVQWLGK